MKVDPCIPVGIQLEKAEAGPTSGSTWRRSHFVCRVQDDLEVGPRLPEQRRPQVLDAVVHLLLVLLERLVVCGELVVGLVARLRAPSQFSSV